MAEPVAHSYGKAAVSVYRTDGDRLFACELALIAHGEVFLPSYTEGDNSMVVATDSMKNFIHAAAADFEGDELEDFLLLVGRTFLERYQHVEAVELSGHEVPFVRRRGAVFQRSYGARTVAEVSLDRQGVRTHRSGIEGLHIVKLSGSSFANFVRDEYTTLPESDDRPLFVHLDVHWRNLDPAIRPPLEGVRATIVESFSALYSASIQHFLHAAGTALLDRFPELQEVSLRGENRLWDTVREGDGVAVFTDARPPFGVVNLTLRR